MQTWLIFLGEPRVAISLPLRIGLGSYYLSIQIGQNKYICHHRISVINQKSFFVCLVFFFPLMAHYRGSINQ